MDRAWFDTTTGELFIDPGEAEAHARLAGTAVTPLAGLVYSPDFPYKPGDFEQQQGDNWNEDDLIRFGVHIVTLLETDPGRTPLFTRPIYNRLRTLGIAPSEHTIADFADYKTRVLGYYALGTAPPGSGVPVDRPKPRWMQEMYSDKELASWEDEDYIEHGLQIVRANTLEGLTPRTITTVANRRAGPALERIAAHFGSWEAFEAQVEAIWLAKQQAAASKAATYRKLLQNGKLPPALNATSDDDLLVAVGKYRIAKEMLPHASEAELLKLVSYKHHSTFVRGLHNRDASVTAGRVEVYAASLSVLDDILPPTAHRYHTVQPEAPFYAVTLTATIENPGSASHAA